MTIWYTKAVNFDRNVPFRTFGAVGKARQDTYQFLDEIGARQLSLFAYKYEDEPSETLNVRFDGILAGVKRGDMIINIYPHFINSERYMETFFRKAHAFGAKVVGYVHDIDYYRYTADTYSDVNVPYQYSYARKRLERYDGLIVPTQRMATRVRRDFEFNNPIVVSGPTGYVTPMIPDRKKKSNQVVFAGNFDKNISLNEITKHSPSLDFNIYGKSILNQNQLELGQNVHYQGNFDPDAIIMGLQGSYGLVWDSLSYPKVSGGTGFYQEINSPFKFSTYLAAELPVIAWSHIGFAEYIIKNNVGWVIDDASQLENLVANISDDDYEQKLNNLELIGSLVRSGTQLKRAVFEMAVTLSEESTYLISNEEYPISEIGIEKWIIEKYRDDLADLKQFYIEDNLLNYFRKNLYQDTEYQTARKILLDLKRI